MGGLQGEASAGQTQEAPPLQEGPLLSSLWAGAPPLAWMPQPAQIVATFPSDQHIQDPPELDTVATHLPYWTHERDHLPEVPGDRLDPQQRPPLLLSEWFPLPLWGSEVSAGRSQPL